MRPVEIMAKTIYGEARGEFNRLEGGLSSLIAIGNVINNRLKSGFFGISVQDICLKPWQFSCWNRRDPNYAIITEVTSDDPIFKICLEVSEKIVNQDMPDLTKGADHYYSSLVKNTPFWALKKNPSTKIGQHLFFNLYGR